MILSLISLLSGGLVRMLPELLALFNKKTDNTHELKMMALQLELQKSKSADDRATMMVQGEQDRLTFGEKSAAEITLAMLDAQKTALAGQMQKLGIRWVDAMNFCVRPIATYYVLAMYGLAKLAMFMIAMQQGIGGWEAILKVYDAEDRAILSGILGFWFVGRVFDSPKK